jgi:hypothetical protein
MARQPTPDEIRPTTKRKSDQYRPEDWMGRIQRGTITSVDPDNGVVTVEMESTPGTRTGVTIPLHFFSFDPANPLSAAWMRYMPQLNDVVKIGFDSNGTTRIVGYDTPSYSDVNTMSANTNFGWTTLQPGEWDLKSVGNAFVKGDRTGLLYLAGGTQSIGISKQNREIDIKTNTLKTSSGASNFRSGVVKRSPVQFQQEVEAKAGVGVPPVQTAANAVLQNLVESTIDLQSSTALIPFGLPVAFGSIGNVMDPDVDEVALSAWGAAGPAGIKKFKVFPAVNARVLFRVYDSVPLTDVPIGTPGPVGGTSFRPFEIGIDQNGNLFINQSPLTNPFGTPGGVEWWSPQQFNIWSNSINFNSVLTRIGNPVTATEPAVCGAIFAAATTTFCSAWETYQTSLTAYLASVAACFAASAGAIVDPVTAADVATQAGILAGASVTFAAAITTYVAAVGGSLSAALLISKLPLVPPPATVPSPFQL